MPGLNMWVVAMLGIVSTRTAYAFNYASTYPCESTVPCTNSGTSYCYKYNYVLGTLPGTITCYQSTCQVYWAGGNSYTSCSGCAYLSFWDGTSCYTSSSLPPYIHGNSTTGFTAACNTGMFCPGGNAELQCPPGTYGPGGVSAAIPCPLGTYTHLSGYSACFTCTNGPSGSHYTTVASSSSACPWACPQGYWGGPATGVCATCPSGSYCPAASSVPSTCPGGTYSPSGSASVSQCQCGPGSWSNGTGCRPCAPGGYSTGLAAISCQNCTTGTFTSNNGSTACRNCTAGTYTDNAMRSICTMCAAGTYSTAMGSDSSTTCVACTAGRYSSGTGATSACPFCPAAYFSATNGSSQCQRCASGTYNPGNLAACLACSPSPANGAFNGSAGTVEACPITCNPGFYATVASGVNVCAACTNIPVGAGATGSGASATSCPWACPAGLVSYQGGPCSHAACNTAMDCNAGSCVAASPQTLYCFQGACSTVTGAACSTCPVYTVWSESTLTCVGVPQGYTTDRLGLSVTPCPAGFSCLGNQFSLGTYPTAYPCLAAGYCPEGSYQKTPCPVGTWAGSGATNVSACQPCVTLPGQGGYIGPGITSTSCEYQCNTGYHYGGYDVGSCHPCANLPSGDASYTGAGSGGASSCPWVCNPGSNLSTDGTACTGPCLPTGQYRTPGGACPQCSLCPPGNYLSANCTTTTDTVCAPCPIGTHQSGYASACTACAVGTFASVTGLSACIPCPIGAYSSITSASQCTPCPAGSYGNASGLSACVACVPGTYLAADGSSCVPCSPGEARCRCTCALTMIVRPL